VAAVAYPEDWTDQDGVACLGSAGAERFLKHFPVRFSDESSERQDWEDDIGKAYTWTYACIAEWKGRRVFVEASYSTRDPFLGKAGGQFKKIEEIDEADIRSAARHICHGAGIKELLGLRRIPVAELVKFGVPQDKIKKVVRTKGAQGGSTADEMNLQKEVGRMILEMEGGDKEKAKERLEKITGFTAKDGKKVKGLKTLGSLKGRRLEITMDKVMVEYDNWKKSMPKQQKELGENE
jgi:hypothetical protein